jgi:putative flippase GtrA
VGMTNSYFWNRYWTFKLNYGRIGDNHILKFCTVYIVALIFNVILLSFLVQRYHINPRIAQIFVLIITTLISFIGHKFWSFRYQEEAVKD